VLTDYDKYVFSIWSKGYKPTWPWWENISLPHTKCHPLYIVCTYLCDNFDVPMYLTFSLVPFLWCRVSGGFYLLFFFSSLLSVSDVATYEIRGIRILSRGLSTGGDPVRSWPFILIKIKWKLQEH
jgi:hypothetical protein